MCVWCVCVYVCVYMLSHSSMHIWHWWYSHDDMHLSLQEGWTALMMVTEAGNLVECMKMLLDRGAKVNMQDMVSGVIIHCVYTMEHVP